MKKDNAKWPSPRPSIFAVAAWAVLAIILASTRNPLRMTPSFISSLSAATAIGIPYLSHADHESARGQWMGIVSSAALLISSLFWIVFFAAILLASEALWTLLFSDLAFLTTQTTAIACLVVGGLVLVASPSARRILDARQPSPTTRIWASILRSAALLDAVVLIGVAPVVFLQLGEYLMSEGVGYFDAFLVLDHPIVRAYFAVLAVVVFLIARRYVPSPREMRAIASRSSAVTPASSPE